MRSSHFGHVLQRRFLLVAHETTAITITHAKKVFLTFDVIVSPGYTCEDTLFYARHCFLFPAFSGRLHRLGGKCFTLSEVPYLCCREKLSMGSSALVRFANLFSVSDEIQSLFAYRMAPTGVTFEPTVLSDRPIQLVPNSICARVHPYKARQITHTSFTFHCA